MPTFYAFPGLGFHVQSIDRAFEDMLTRAEPTEGTGAAATLLGELYRYELVGTDLTYDGDGALTGGTLESFTAFLVGRSGYELRFSELGFDIADLVALAADEVGGNGAALEGALYGLDWTLTGNGNGSRFERGDTSDDGVPINLSGDNFASLDWGIDLFHAGAGNDTVRGGGLDDVIWGGAGRDKLHGGGGHDALYGGPSHDKLRGGFGFDLLEGGGGNDMLQGGARRDTLTGGDGADTFRFAYGDGPDLVTDFTPGIDRLQITATRAIEIEDYLNGVLVTVGPGDSIFLDGVLEADLEEGDIDVTYVIDPEILF